MYNPKLTATIAALCLIIPANLLSQIDTIPKQDPVLLKQIEQELKAKELQVPALRSGTAPTALPDISVIGDFQASYRNNARKKF